MICYLGIDIGSSTSKGVLKKDGSTVAQHLLLSGVNYRLAAQKLVDEIGRASCRERV